MKTRENAVFAALQRAKSFFDDNGVALTGVVDLAAGRKRLEEVIATFTAHALDQNVGDRGARGETAKQHQLRMNLRSEQMEPIAVIARRNLRTTPEFTALQMPKRSVIGQAFISSARGMADAATIHKDTLIAHGMPTTFLDDLNTATTNLEGSMTERERNRSKRISATKGLDVEEKQGKTVLSVLDAQMKQALRDNESLLRAWQAARLIRRRTGASGSTTAPTSTGTPTPTPAPIPVPAPATPEVSASQPPTPVSESTPA